MSEYLTVLVPAGQVYEGQHTHMPLTVDAYRQLVNEGLFEDERVELLEGWLVRKVTKNDPHLHANHMLYLFLIVMILQGKLSWSARKEEPIILSGRSMPEPDITIARGTDTDYARRRPTPDDIGIVVEVADPSVHTDYGSKLRLYALSGIVAYWIVNIPERRVEVYTQPDAATGTYAARTDYAVGEAVPVVLDGVEVGTIPVADLFAAS